MWSNNSGGVDRITDARRQEPTSNKLACQIKQLNISEEEEEMEDKEQDMQTELEEEYEDEHEDASWACLAVEHSMWEEKIRASARTWSPTTRLKFGIRYHIIKEETVPAPKRASTMTAADRKVSEEMLNQLRRDHGDAKAVKSDDAEVPEHIWNEVVCHGPPSEDELRALSMLRKFCLQWYCRKLWLEARKYLIKTHGKDWTEKLNQGKSNLIEDVQAIQLILWRAGSNNWFEYPYGSSLLFFCFPARYRTQAKQGVRVMFTCKGPTSGYPQPRLKPDEKEVMKKKIRKLID